jgi:hypothetical protein
MTYDELLKKYPKLYSRLSYFECDEGWISLIDSLSQKLEDINNNFKSKKSYIRAEQVKEKFGGLRFYYSSENVDEQTLNLIDSYISEAEKHSRNVCQLCGSEADFAAASKTNWIVTLCNQCKNMK